MGIHDDKAWLVFTVLCCAAVVYYTFVYRTRPRAVVYLGEDTRVQGVYQRLSAQTTTRQHYTSESAAHLVTPWSNEVWQNRSNPQMCIFDHHVSADGKHVWSLGAWDPESGGHPPGRTYATCYSAVQKKRRHWYTMPQRMQDALHNAVIVASTGEVIGALVQK